MTGSDLSHLMGGEIIPDAPSLEGIEAGVLITKHAINEFRRKNA